MNREWKSQSSWSSRTPSKLLQVVVTFANGKTEGISIPKLANADWKEDAISWIEGRAEDAYMENTTIRKVRIGRRVVDLSKGGNKKMMVAILAEMK